MKACLLIALLAILLVPSASGGTLITNLPNSPSFTSNFAVANNLAAGFRTCTWYPSDVSPEDIAHYGDAYWQDWRENCVVIGLVCQK